MEALIDQFNKSINDKLTGHKFGFYDGSGKKFMMALDSSLFSTFPIQRFQEKSRSCTNAGI